MSESAATVALWNLTTVVGFKPTWSLQPHRDTEHFVAILGFKILSFETREI